MPKVENLEALSTWSEQAGWDHAEFERLLKRCREAGAADTCRTFPLKEQLVVSLTLNRLDWLEEAGYTVPAALGGIDPAWRSMVAHLERRLREAPSAGEESTPRNSGRPALTRFGAPPPPTQSPAKVYPWDGKDGLATITISAPIRLRMKLRYLKFLGALETQERFIIQEVELAADKLLREHETERDAR
ncbi:MAG: hypothetical protein JSS56_01730 [Proteobacteria bacterium]|nr:hypothetical protein [Pseudomonadota bacterium]